jgi:2'-5' RNA ligase
MREMDNKTIRAFFAIPISADCRHEIDMVVSSLKNELTPCIRWVDVEDLHITLKFLGEFKQSDVAPIMNRLEANLSKINQFKIIFQNLGVFPNERNPRVVWIGITFPHNLKQLFEEIEKTGFTLGYPKEERGFSPHITIGRVKKAAQNQDLIRIGKVIQNRMPYEICKSQVKGITLFQSRLSPSGPLYSELFSIGFKE